MSTATEQLYLAEQARVAATLAAVRRQWDSARTPRQGEKLIPRLAALVAAAMAGAAEDGSEAVGVALAEAGFPVEPVALVVPEAFGWSASDGRPLESLLRVGAVRSQSSMTAGRMWLDVAVHTQVADAARAGSSVAIAMRPRVGYVRFVNPPCCQRCAVLAGKWFKWNQGFHRHPRCDCVHRAQHEDARGGMQDVPLDQVTDLSSAQRMAMEDGADLGRVVNVRRGRMTTAGGPGGRLTPEDVYRIAQSREEAVRLLARNGYVVGDAQTVARLAG